MSYDVGYGKPPKGTQFKKGHSGNPKGRPKGVLNLATAVNRALNERIEVTEHGRKRSMSKFDVMIKGLVNRAVKGEPKAMQQMLSLSPLFGMEDVSTDGLPETDAMVLKGLVGRLRKQGRDGA